MNAPEIVRRYAVTLLETAAEAGELDRVSGDVGGIAATLRQSAELTDFLANPLIGVELKRSALEQLFSDKVAPLALSFMLLMTLRRRAGIIQAALEAFVELAEERAGTVRAEVRAAASLTDEQSERLRQRLAAYTGKDIRLHTVVDPALRGGMVARVGDIVFDGSLGRQLERLQHRLLGS
jgi:F-type H+-transporting ATPase subunit delta